MAPRTSDPATLAARVERYRHAAVDDPRAMVQLGRRLWAGEEITAASALALGRSTSLVGIVASDFERAGYAIRRHRDGHHGVARSLVGAPDNVQRSEVAYDPRGPVRAITRRKRPHPTPDPHFANGVPNPSGVVEALQSRLAGLPHHPPLGALVEVRAVALDGDDGGLVLHLAAGGQVWQVRVTGHAPA